LRRTVRRRTVNARRARREFRRRRVDPCRELSWNSRRCAASLEGRGGRGGPEEVALCHCYRFYLSQPRRPHHGFSLLADALGHFVRVRVLITGVEELDGHRAGIAFRGEGTQDAG